MEDLSKETGGGHKDRKSSGIFYMCVCEDSSLNDMYGGHIRKEHPHEPEDDFCSQVVV